MNNYKKLDLNRLNTMFEGIGISVQEDGNMYYFDNKGTKTTITDTFFQVRGYYEVITASGNTYYEVKLIPFNNIKSLPEIKIKIDSLEKGDWIKKNYGGRVYVNSLFSKSYKFIYETIMLQVKEAETTIEYSFIGWNKENQYILGNEIINEKRNTIHLGTKEQNKIPHDSIKEYGFLNSNISEYEANEYIRKVFLKAATPFISKTTLSFLLLSVVTSRFHDFPEKPGFVLVFRGISGTRKSSWLKATMHVLKKHQGHIITNFTGSTAGILSEAASIRDLIFSVDDLFPSNKKMFDKMTQVLITLLRIYSDNTRRVVCGKNYAVPDNLLVVTCEEVPQTLAPSDYARMLVLTFEKSTVNTNSLSELQNNYSKTNRFLKYFISHIASKGNKYLEDLFKKFKDYQVELMNELPNIPGRLQSMGAWLISQYNAFLEYQVSINYIKQEEKDNELSIYKKEVIRHLKVQSSEFTSIDPSVMYCKALMNMINQGELIIKEITKDKRGKNIVDIKFNKAINENSNSIIYPEKFLGFKLYGDYYLIHNIAYKAVKQFCLYNDYPFVFSDKRILSVLVERGLIEKEVCGENNKSPNTQRLKVGKHQHRVVKISIEDFERFANGGIEYGD